MKQRKEWDCTRPCLINDLSDTDPLGMYTGVPQEPMEQPEQDADDL